MEHTTRSTALIVARDPTLIEHLVRDLRALGWIAVSITNVFDQDGCYRRFAFDMGIAAYASKSCARDRLREMLGRLQRGERRIELVTSSVA